MKGKRKIGQLQRVWVVFHLKPLFSPQLASVHSNMLAAALLFVRQSWCFEPVQPRRVTSGIKLPRLVG